MTTIKSESKVPTSKVKDPIHIRHIKGLIKDVSGIEYSFRKVIPMNDWDDTITRIEGSLYDLLDGHLPEGVYLDVQYLSDFMDRYKDKVTPHQKSFFYETLNKVIEVYDFYKHPTSKPENNISIQDIKNVMIDIISDDEWVNDSQTMSEHKGIVSGLNMLVNHFTEIK